MLRQSMVLICSISVLAALTTAEGANDYPRGYQGLMPLPENPHYFQWKGLPMFGVRGGGTGHWYYSNVNFVSRGNDTRFFCNTAAHGGTSSLSPEQAVASESQYKVMASEAKTALSQDRGYNVAFFHKNWCSGTTSTTLMNNAIKYLWDLPNVNFSYIYEGPTSSTWIAKFKELGAKANPNVKHMFYSVQNGTPAAGVDFLLGEGSASGIQWGFPATVTSSYLSSHQYPLLRDAVVQCLCPGKTSSGANTCFNVGTNGCVAASATSSTATIMRKQVLMGVNSGTPYGRDGIDASYQAYSVQIRWYVENMRTFENEPGDELVDSKLPKYVKSNRPSITNPTGFSDGAKIENGKIVFAAVYKDADGDAPAQAEVWADLNDDGKFSANPSKGERILLKSSSTSYASGVTYTSEPVKPIFTGTKPVRYVFRFADKNWYPPVASGLMKAASPQAYGYGHWTTASVSGGSATGVRQVSKDTRHVIVQKNGIYFFGNTDQVRTMNLYSLQGSLMKAKKLVSGETLSLMTLALPNGTYIMDIVDYKGASRQLLRVSRTDTARSEYRPDTKSLERTAGK